ncbi:MFS transporter [Salinispora vitiensis]|uniref:MFS transporter n=1 Tax=Salinispora vitiensis TaxID=999544 RepID=UPI0009B720EC|nr:MFS transporter [Salinispora vitiensis]
MRKHYRLALTSLGMGIAEFGDVAYVVSLAASLYLSGSRSAIHLSFAMAAYGVGSLAGSWLGGALVDVLPARRWIVTGNLLAGGLVLVNTVATTLVAVVAFAGAVSCASRAMLVGQQTVLPLVEPDDLVRANSVVMVSRRIGQLASPALAGGLVAAGRLDWVYVVNAGTFCIAGLMMFVALPPGGRVSRLPRMERGSRIRDSWHAPAVWSAFAVNSVTGVIVGVSSVSIVVYTGSVLGGGAAEYAALAAFAAVGAVLGTLTASLVGRLLPTKPAVGTAVAVAGAALAALPFVTWLPAAAVLRVASGWSVNVVFILLMANLHEGAPAALRGRLIAATRSGQDTLMIVMTMASGFLIAQAGVRWILLAAGLLAGLCALLLAVSRDPFDWRPAVRQDDLRAAAPLPPQPQPRAGAGALAER